MILKYSMAWFRWKNKKDVDVLDEVNPMLFSQDQDEVLEEIVEVPLSLAEREKEIRKAREPKTGAQKICADLPEELYQHANDRLLKNTNNNMNPEFASFPIKKKTFINKIRVYGSEKFVLNFYSSKKMFLYTAFPCLDREQIFLKQLMEYNNGDDVFFSGFIFPKPITSSFRTPEFLPYRINKDYLTGGDWEVDPHWNLIGSHHPTESQYKQLIKAYSQEAIDEVYAPLNLDFVTKKKVISKGESM